jgi:sporulation protein YlmC with PRC-barrel domain
MKKSSSFYADFVGKPVISAGNVAVGKIKDMTILMGEEFPPIKNLVVIVASRRRGLNPFKNRELLVIPWEDVACLSKKAVYLSVFMEEIVPGTVEHNELFIYRDVMDEEIVDRYGKHLFRVNDVVLRIQKGKLRVIGIQADINSMLLRLGPEREIFKLVNLFRKKIVENIIMWDHVKQYDKRMRYLKLDISKKLVKNLYNL